MSKDRIKKVKHRGFEYPDFLFYEKAVSRKNISSSARFDPLAATTTQNPWQNSTKPSQDPEKKAIILDLNSFEKPIDSAQEIAFIKTLLDQGFRIFLRTTDEIKEVKDKVLQAGDINLLQTSRLIINNSLKEFSESDHTIILNNFSVAKDKAVKIRLDDLRQIKQTFFSEHFKEIWQYHHHYFSRESGVDDRDTAGIFRNPIYYFYDKSDFEDDIEPLEVCPASYYEELLRIFPEHTDKIIQSFSRNDDSENIEAIIEILSTAPQYGNKILENILEAHGRISFKFNFFASTKELLDNHPEFFGNLIKLFELPKDKIEKTEKESCKLLLTHLLKNKNSDLKKITLCLNSIDEDFEAGTLIDAIKNYPQFVSQIKKKINLKQYLEILPLLISENFDQAQTYINWISDFNTLDQEDKEVEKKAETLSAFLKDPSKIPELVTSDILGSLLAIAKDDKIKYALIVKLDKKRTEEIDQITFPHLFNYIKFAPNQLEEISIFCQNHDIFLNLYCYLRFLKTYGLDALRTVSCDLALDNLAIEQYEIFLGAIDSEEVTKIIDDENIFRLVFDRIFETLRDDPDCKDKVEEKIDDLIFAINKKYLTREFLDQLINDDFDQVQTRLILFLQLRKLNPENSDLLNLRIVSEKYELDSEFIDLLREKEIISYLTYIQIEDYRDEVIKKEVHLKKFKPSEFNERSKPTFVYIPNLSINFDIKSLKKKVEEGGLADSVVSIQINRFDIYDLDIGILREISKLFPNLSCITLVHKDGDKILSDAKIELQKKSINILTSLFPNCDVMTTNLSSISYTPLIDPHKKPKKNGIYIHSGDLLMSQINDANNKNNQPFKMEKVGEILNPSENIYVRTDILDQNNRPKQEGYSFYYYPKHITKNDLKILRKDKTSGKTHCKFVAGLRANIPTRLKSISANNEEISIVSESFPSSQNIIFLYGKDGFSYAISNVDQNLEYVVSAEKVQKNYNKISNEKIKEIIKKYKENCDKKNEAIPQIENFANRDAWLKALYEAGNGRCESRVEAVCHVLKEAGIDEELYQRTQINRSHLLIEIYDLESKEWIQIDLGGVNARIEYEPENESESENEPENESESENEIEIDEQEQEDLQSEEKQETYVQKIKREKLEESKETEKAKETEKNDKTKYPLELLIEKLTAVKEKTIDLEKEQISSQKTLLISSQIEQTANELLKKARDQKRHTFYLENFEQTNFALETLEIRNENGAIRQANQLQDFLQNNNSATEFSANESPILIINWENFSAAQRASLNTMIDANNNRSINGQFIANNIQIISLVKTKPQDLSFISRHQDCLKVKQKIIETPKAIKPIIIDLNGREDVEAVLFGKFLVEENKIKWQFGTFTEAVNKSTDEIKKVKFINLSTAARAKLEHIFDQAKARKFIDYYGEKIYVARDIAVEYEEEKFDFSQFEKTQTTITSKVTLQQTPVDAKIINTFLFDILLNQKEVHDGKYLEKDGLIKENSGKTLKLFITSNLSQAQFYCMLSEAKKHNCKLELYLAPDVEMPKGFTKKNYVEQGLANVQDKIKRIKPKIFISNNTKLTTQTLGLKISDNPLIIDIEDYSYQDLFSRIAYKKTVNGFEDFKIIINDVLQAINSGRKVILRGEFGEDLQKMLEPVIAAEPPTFSEVGENLILIIEDKDITKTQKSHPTFSWLENSDYKISFEEKDKTIAKRYSYKEEVDNSPIDEHYEEKSAEFIAQRKKTFLKFLEHNSLISLIGPSGVGKSSFMRLINKEESHHISVHEDLSNFEEWAKNPDSNTQYKILFIDESNIEDMHFTMFEQLKKGGNREILYKGKLYQLTEKHHVVFARNPIKGLNGEEYGGGRVEQKLFFSGDTAEMHFADFPAAYLYEELLKKAIYDKLPQFITVQLSEKEFRRNCKKFIEAYQDINKNNRDPNQQQTARELQDQALRFVAEGFQHGDLKILSADFVSTDATAAAENALNSALTLKIHQKKKELPSDGIGINGVLLEGLAGTGKSELIKAIFAKRNIKPASRQQNEETQPNFHSPYCYYKIEASMPIAEKIRLLVKAFEEGNIAWIDELNSCIEDDQLEKTLNALLTGINPITKKPLSRPGGLLVSSINSAALEGRSIIGPALRHRMFCPRITSLAEYKTEDFVAILSAWITEKQGDLSNYKVVDFANDLHEYFAKEKNPQLNLRIIKENLPEFLEIYPTQKLLDAELLRNLNNRKDTAQKLHAHVRKRKAEYLQEAETDHNEDEKDSVKLSKQEEQESRKRKAEELPPTSLKPLGYSQNQGPSGSYKV